MEEFTQERKLIVVKVGKPPVRTLPLFSIRKFILEKKAMSILNVVRLLLESLFLLAISEFTLERSLMDVLSAGKHLGMGQALCNIREHILGISLVGKSYRIMKCKKSTLKARHHKT